MDGERLAAMLAGERSIDVDTALRLSRSLQLPAERIMQRQVRFDFAAARNEPDLAAIEIVKPNETAPFPATFLVGRLASAADSAGAPSVFFQQDVDQKVTGDKYAGMHALWRGDRLRIYAPAAGVLWTGPILHDLDGRVLLPGVRSAEWCAWFEAGYRADFAVGEDHAAFFQRMYGA